MKGHHVLLEHENHSKCWYCHSLSNVFSVHAMLWQQSSVIQHVFYLHEQNVRLSLYVTMSVRAGWLAMAQTKPQHWDFLGHYKLNVINIKLCMLVHVVHFELYPPPPLQLPPLYWDVGPHTYRDVQCSVNHVKRNVCCRVSQAEEHGSAGVWPPGHQSQCHCGHSVPYESQQLDTRGGVHTKQTNTCWETLFGGAWLIVWQSHKWVDI